MAKREIALRALGQYLAQNFPGEAILVIGNPFSQMPGRPDEVYDYEKASLRGLRAVVPAAQCKVAYPEVRAAFLKDPSSIQVDPRTTTPLSFIVDEKSWDRLAQRHPECTVFLSLIGLPEHCEKLEIWNSPQSKFAFLLPDWRVLGGPGTVRRAFRSGKIAAAVLPKPTPAAGSDSDASGKEDFDEHFLLVTPETVDHWMTNYPSLF